MEDFLLLLKQHDINYLLDVRSKPYSKFNPDYSRSQLEAYLAAAGIKYVYMGESLGGQPQVASVYTKDGKVDYEKIKSKEFYRSGIQRLREAWEQGLRVALMCSEARPETCHRSKLIGETLVEAGIDVIHIDENGHPQTQQQVLLRLTGGQLGFPDLFDPGFTSRKRYQTSGEEDDQA
jgi:uncharacterized protein (DUF488 family)